LATLLARSLWGGALPRRPDLAVVRADCVVGITPLQSPSITCFSISGGEARGKADCIFAPDRNTEWISRPGGSTGPACFFDARGAVLETRSF
jgi:hypothetical protein